jgi:hypothetical protein
MQHGQHGTAVSVHPVYSTVCTMVGVALPYQVHVHAAWYGSFHTPGVQYCLYHHWCCLATVSYAFTPVHASWYGMVGASLPYRMHVHVALYGSFRTRAVQYLLYHAGPWFDVAQFASIAVVSHLFVLQQTPHWSLPSSNLLFFLLLSSFFASLSTPVSFSFLVSVQSIIVLSCWSFGRLHPDEFGDCFSCLLLVDHYHFCIPGVQYCLYHAGWVGVSLPYRIQVHTAWYGSFCTPAVQYCLYHFTVIAVSPLFVYSNSSIRLSLLSLSLGMQYIHILLCIK